MKNRINSISTYLKNQLGGKTVKLSIDQDFTCPNRDGTKGYGGCLFCSASGSGDMASNIEDQIELLSDKWPNAENYIAYFQNHTNTYGPVEELRQKYMKALSDPKISGIAIATRPDCLPEDVLDLLGEINKEHFMWVELGLQTTHQTTMDEMNLCYTLSDFDRAINELNKRNIKTVVHLILGLPGETREMMEESVRYVCNSHPWGLKLHLLNVVKGSQMEKLYPDYLPFESIDEYVNLICDMLEIIPEDIVIHRLTGDAPRKTLISPPWSYRKRTILNSINQEMTRRDSYQGIKVKK